jgi:hypothetical protein
MAQVDRLRQDVDAPPVETQSRELRQPFLRVIFTDPGDQADAVFPNGHAGSRVEQAAPRNIQGRFALRGKQIVSPQLTGNNKAQDGNCAHARTIISGLKEDVVETTTTSSFRYTAMLQALFAVTQVGDQAQHA